MTRHSHQIVRSVNLSVRRAECYSAPRAIEPWLTIRCSRNHGYPSMTTAAKSQILHRKCRLVPCNPHRDNVQGTSKANLMDHEGKVATIYFATNQATLGADDIRAINEVYNMYHKYTDPRKVTLRFVGYADLRGGEKYNYDLALKRARRVALSFSLSKPPEIIRQLSLRTATILLRLAPRQVSSVHLDELTSLLRRSCGSRKGDPPDRRPNGFHPLEMSYRRIDIWRHHPWRVSLWIRNHRPN